MALLRVSPHRIVPIVAGGQLVGLLTERCLTSALLSAQDAPGREALRTSLVSSLMQPPGPTLLYTETPEAFLEACDQYGLDTLPLVEASGRFVGLMGRSDLIEELLTPPRLPMIGGMATPLGVYLTSGAVSGGTGGYALILSGVLTLLAQTSLFLSLNLAGNAIREQIPVLWLTWVGLSQPVRESLGTLFSALIFGGAFLTLLRISPLAGYHAAEHQVVHAMERGEPLLIESVQLMPREHPRCGTNFIAGAALLATGSALVPLIGGFGYIIGGLAALAGWRSLGGWLQRHFTTRRATQRQLESGIRAANELLTRQAHHGDEPAGGLARLWRSGMVHILLGYALGGGILALIGWLLPPLGSLLLPSLQELMS